MQAAPLIVTLEADPESQARFDADRGRWFPSERNLVPAHVTLYHHLPGDRAVDVATRLAKVAARPRPAFRVASVMPLGRGAAYRLDLPAGDTLKREIGAGFELTAQDRGGLRAHVTVQNKVSRETATATLEALRASFAPWDGEAVALRLWWYRGGPWDAAGRYPFDEA
ncbi:2'-5' RNA ligase family protein [uncultured Jannaschia sp.]|uniref:2'-5' RNA ligase family protein n=1 Tax=uncultured Jannaschia sp. TaxID=293347 RepID=UPI002601F267|nr:2'-5' RNA ligase family protein [uncultured Jannaschia sp.]